MEMSPLGGMAAWSSSPLAPDACPLQVLFTDLAIYLLREKWENDSAVMGGPGGK